MQKSLFNPPNLYLHYSGDSIVIIINIEYFIVQRKRSFDIYVTDVTRMFIHNIQEKFHSETVQNTTQHVDIFIQFSLFNKDSIVTTTKR